MATCEPRVHRRHFTWNIRSARCLGPGAALLALAALVAGAGGCGKPLLSAEEQRSQFDRYDDIRNQYAPQYITDEYGQRTPNLRARLGPKE